MLFCGVTACINPQIVLAATAGSVPSSNMDRAARPNVIIILTDDLGYGDVSAYNPHSKIKTPNIDALAKSGILFTDGHSGSTVCTPSRYSLLTGEYAWRGPLREGVLMPWDGPVLDQKQDTLAELFSRSGYEAAHIGKWHLGFIWPWKDGAPARSELLKDTWISAAVNEQFDWNLPLHGGPVDHGFNSYFGDDVPNFPPYAWIENDKIKNPEAMVDVQRSTLITAGYSGGIHGSGPGEAYWSLAAVTPMLQRRAVEFISAREGSEQPYFLNLWLTSPHTPVVPLPEFDGKSEAGTYGDYVVQTDALVGAVVKALVDTGQFENTMIWLTSDNGPETFAYRLMRRFDHDGVAGRRGIKGDTWEGGHRVPFIISWPGGEIPKGKVETSMVSQIDIYATIASLLNATIPDGAARDSVSLLGLLRGEETEARHSLVYHAANGNLGFRDRNWVYLQNGGFGRGPGKMWEEPQWLRERRGVIPNDTPDALYDLSTDPNQLNNVIDAFPKVAKRLRLKLASQTQRTQDGE